MTKIIQQFDVKGNAIFPNFDFFNQLGQKLKDDSRVKVITGGHSKNGKQLTAFVVGTGSKVVGVTSGAHADEPIGVLTQAYFINGLLKNNYFDEILKQYTFVCNPLVDPDGYELNSKWFTNPLDFKNYYLHNYRNNKPSEDCEHGIPFQEGQAARPEMIFVKDSIDLFKGKFEYYVTLHSSHILPGACFVFDRDHSDVALRGTIADICKTYDLPLMDYKSRGDDTMTYLGPGFIGAPNVTSMLEHYKNHPEILKQIKMTTYEYAQTYCGAKSAFISELPIWVSQGFDDYSDSKMTMNDYKKVALDFQKSYLNQLVQIDKEISPFNPSEENVWFSSLKTAIKRGMAMIQDEEEKLGTYSGHAQVLEVKELDVQEFENKSKAYKYGIKSIEGLPNADAKVKEMTENFNIAVQEYEK